MLRGQVALEKVVLQGATVRVETRAADASNWAMTPPAPRVQPEAGDRATAMKLSLERLQIDALRLEVKQAGSDALRTIDLRSLTVEPQAGSSQIRASLQHEGRTWQIDATTGRLMDLLARQSPWPYAVAVATEGARFSARGEVPAGAAQPWQFEFGARVTDMHAFAGLLPTTGLPLPLEAQALVRRDGGTAWRADGARLTAGGQVATAALEWIPGAVPRLTARVEADSIDAQALWPRAAGAAPAQGPRSGPVFPDSPFPLGRWPAIEAAIEARIGRLTGSPTMVMEDVRATLRVAPDAIELASWSLRIAGGSARGSARYRWAADPAALQVRVDASGLALATLAPAVRRSDLLRGGTADLAIDLQATGRSPRQFAASARGEARVVARDMRLGPKATAAGTDVVAGLLRSLRPDRSVAADSTVTCAVVRLPLKNGRAEVQRSIAAESEEVDVVALGYVDFRRETLSLAFRPRVKRGIGISAARIASLVRLEGPLDAPRLGIDTAGAASQLISVGAAVATGGWSLLGERLLPSSVPRRPCAEALRGARLRAPG